MSLLIGLKHWPTFCRSLNVKTLKPFNGPELGGLKKGMLIPVGSPLHLGDFQPISLLGSLYKLVAKVLAGRLAVVMDKIISPNQPAYIKGSQLVDGVVAINEIINLAKKSRKRDLVLMQSVRLGFESACVFSGCLSIVVNGSQTQEINTQKGLKQGDPQLGFYSGFKVGNSGLGVILCSSEKQQWETC
ncbi:cysteine-rich receptor-like protein kinase [Trifolium medium]|uniref:Cysteine-rich receptor-like protein kinase n=1 Tax=Trifolium medium TaxID=97028 RepID=A0A392M4D5_9FABA|nr:cysteine-rich receptor-like protein kinase [Trifolium medium]